ncbi:MAG: hypothetical protein ACJ77A_02950 [Actinomycetota bacterium]
MSLQPMQDGRQTLVAEAFDRQGNTSMDIINVVVDTTAPVPRTASGSLVRGVVSGTGVAVFLYYRAEETRPDHYNLWQTVDGGVPAKVDTTKGGWDLVRLRPGHLYGHRTKAFDRAGNSAWSEESHRRIRLSPETALSISGKWRRLVDEDALGDHVLRSSDPGARASFNLQADQVGLVVTTGPAAGKIRAWVAGWDPAIIDLYSRHPLRRRIFPVPYLDRSPLVHIEVLGSKNPLSTGHRVDIDGIVSLAERLPS